MKILMVCLGNICRSPLAEGIMQHLVKQQGLDWEVDSAGTGNWHIGKDPTGAQPAQPANMALILAGRFAACSGKAILMSLIISW